MTSEEREASDQMIQVAEGVGFVARPAGAARLGEPWTPLATLPLTVIVGVTGVGKSTTLDLLGQGRAISLLPNRRVVADEVVIGTMQALDGQRPRPVTDRSKRFDYTRRYREMFGGGVAHALTRLVVDPTRWPSPLIFDGLRGREEVAYAVAHLPLSRFVVLHAPDDTRVMRLLGRGDAFDRTIIEPSGDTLAQLRTLPGIGAVFTPEQIEHLASLPGSDGGEVVKQVAIVLAERRNYDPAAARQHLERHLTPDRLLVIDTTEYDAAAVAARVAEWLA